MAQNYAVKYQKTIDERFYLDSVTSDVINKGGVRLDFAGVNSVTLYTIDAVTEGNYVRTGTNRFGTLAEIGTGKQTFVLSQDKAFTNSIDRGNYEDSMMVTAAADYLQRVIRETCAPNTDIYRLATIQAYGVANSQSATTALSASNVYTKFLDGTAALDNQRVPQPGRYAFVPPATANFLKQDSNFIKASDIAQDMLEKGVIGKVDGVTIVKVPISYLPANTGFVMTHREVMVSPTKFETYRTLDNVQGIDGWVVEGRRYYDAFIPTNKGKGIWVHMNA